MRDRLGLPVLLPILAVGVILLTIFSFGHLLLQVQESGQAWPIAIAAAAAILLVASILATQPKLTGWPIYVATALPAAVILATGFYYLARPGESTGGGEAVVAIPPPGPLQEIATDNKFNPASFTILVSQQYTLNLTNNGTALHNWHLLGVTGADGKEITTALLSAGGTESTSFTIAQTGTFKYQCDVHPAEMVGQLQVVDQSAAAASGGAAATGGNPGPGTIVEVTTDNKFSQTALNATANQATTLTVENKGQALHNVHIQGVKDTAGQEVQTALIPGGATNTTTFTIATAGTYNFICDVHPAEMKGTITIK